MANTRRYREYDFAPLKLIFEFSIHKVIDDVMRQLSSEEIELDGEADFVDVARSGVESSSLSHDESFRVDDLDLNLNEPEPIMEEVITQDPIVEDVIVEDYVSSGKDSSKDAGTDDDDEDEDFLTDEENEIVEPGATNTVSSSLGTSCLIQDELNTLTYATRT
ncbi:hypothetical protein Tco_0359218 [Tanacetum coccineum]